MAVTNVIAFRPEYLKPLSESNTAVSEETKTKSTKSNRTRENAKDVYTIEEAKMVCDYFKNSGEWIHYLVFSLSFNSGRRISDILTLRWCDVFDASTGEFRDYLNIREKKTGKFSSPAINAGMKKSVLEYLQEMGINPENDGHDNSYNGFVFMQHVGTHKGKVLTYAGAYRGIKRAAEKTGIKSKVATHSARRLYGKTICEENPNDPTRMECLQEMYGHSDQKVTRRYIGITKSKIDKYSDDVGRVFTEFIDGDRNKQNIDNKYIVSLSTPDLRSIIMMAVEEGYKCNSEKDKMTTINKVLSYAETLLK